MSMEYAAFKSYEKTQRRMKTNPGGGAGRRGPILTPEERKLLGQRTYRKPTAWESWLKWVVFIALLIVGKAGLYFLYQFMQGA